MNLEGQKLVSDWLLGMYRINGTILRRCPDVKIKNYTRRGMWNRVELESGDSI